MMPKFRINLRMKLMAILLSLSVLSIVVSAYITFLSSDHYFKQLIFRSSENLANVKSQAIDNFIKDRISQIERIAALPTVVSAVGKLESAERNENSPVYQELNKTLAAVLWDKQRYEEIFILNSKGKVLVSTVYENEDKSSADAQYFINGLKETFIDSIFISEAEGVKKLNIVISAPIKDENGKVTGVLAGRLNLEKLHQLVQDEKGLGKTGETVVGKKVGDEVIFMANTRYDDKAALNRKISLGSELGYDIQEAASGRTGNGFIKDYRGIEVLATWQSIPSLNWGLVVKLDAKEALEPIINTRNIIGLLTVGLVLIVVFLSSIISKGIVKPLRQLTQAADSISKGNLDVKLEIKTKDEVGDLADSFERMLASIRFLKEQK